MQREKKIQIKFSCTTPSHDEFDSFAIV